ncbi:MAG: tripartite tricarboxylate transporter permease [Defluviicoccus sp.]|nr:tripartite tricarboxylate transporter permease [Defluviicoccus sp.]MDE0386483.1 tripartite tricarboxylate transporter permease [Defluviicoccus sp.]
MLEALLTGLDSIFELQVLLFLGLGIFIGIWLGAVPGLGGIIGMLLLLPFTFDMEPLSAIALLLGLFAVTTTSDTIASVMLGIPGTAASQATILDGYPLAKRGEAPRAFGAAFAVSAYGGVFGAVALAISLPIVQPLILAFGSPEIFALALLGLAMVGALSGGSMVKGLAAAAMGLLLSTVGAAQTVAEERYSMGLEYLVDDLPLIPVVLGIFAIPELMELATRNISIARETASQDTRSSIREGVRDAVRHGWLATRCAAIGTYVGMLPGLGAAIVDWVAYGHAVQSARDKSRFGEGDIRGVIAPEAANNATKGGALIPAVAFAIPGSLGTAILLSALILQDIRPGPDMLTTELHITFSMVWMLVIANMVAAGLLMMWSRQVARLAFVPGHFLVPGVIVFVFMGSWLGGLSTIEAWLTCFLFGVVGYLMKAGGWARPPLILGLILGTIVENRFLLSMTTYDGIGWLANPIVLIVLALGILTIVLSARSTLRSNAQVDAPRVGEGRARNPAMSFPVSLLFFAAFAAAAWTAAGWEAEVGQFPLVMAAPGAVLAAVALLRDTRSLTAGSDAGGRVTIVEGAREAVLARSALFLAWLAATILATLLLGMKIALPLFVFAYLLVWGRMRLAVCTCYALAIWGLLVGFYDRIIRLTFHDSLAHALVAADLPVWLPGWLFL